MQPINQRKTRYTDKLSQNLSEHISNKPVGHIEIDLNLGMTSPFPSLSQASKLLCVPILDPETLSDYVSELLPEIPEEEQNKNSIILFEQQALLIIEVTLYAALRCLSSLLQQYFPRSEDYELAFNKALDKLKPQIDSIMVNSEMYLETQIIQATKNEFEEIIRHLSLDEEEE